VVRVATIAALQCIIYMVLMMNKLSECKKNLELLVSTLSSWAIFLGLKIP
jgi:hypothetical protein